MGRALRVTCSVLALIVSIAMVSSDALAQRERGVRGARQPAIPATPPVAAYVDNPELDNIDTLGASLARCLQQRNITSYSAEITSPNSAIGNLLYWSRGLDGRPSIQHAAVFNDITVAQPDQAAEPRCRATVEVTADTQLSLLGVINTRVRQGEVYRIQYRAMSTQSLNRNRDGTSAWLGRAQRGRVRDVIDNTIDTAAIDEAYGVTEITVWMVTVEKYRNVSASGGVTMSLAAGGVSYQRDVSLQENYIVITGEVERLHLSTYSSQVEVQEEAARQVVAEAEARQREQESTQSPPPVVVPPPPPPSSTNPPVAPTVSFEELAAAAAPAT